jgi:hypothetical protein
LFSQSEAFGGLAAFQEDPPPTTTKKVEAVAEQTSKPALTDKDTPETESNEYSVVAVPVGFVMFVSLTAKALPAYELQSCLALS